MRKYSFSILFLFFVANGFAGNQEIKSSSVRFEIKNAGITVEGSFDGLSGQINFDPLNYAKSAVDLQLPSASINTGIGSRDNHLRKVAYFDVENFPSIRMKSKFFGKASEDGAFRGYFTLTLKGVSKEITMPFTCIKEGDAYRVKGDFIINRRDFGVGGKSLIMGDEVHVFIEVMLSDASKSKKNPSPKPIRSKYPQRLEAILPSSTVIY